MTTHRAPAAGLQGHHAGVVTRFAAFLVDLVAVWFLFALAGRGLEYVLTALRGEPVALAEAPLLSGIALTVWAFLYCAYPLATSGRTLGMAVLGVRALRLDGHELDWPHAVLRVVTFPLSFLLFGAGFALILLRRDRRALHDLIARTAVVYAWDARAARLGFLTKR